MSLARDNCNPLNLRPLARGEKWRGQTGISTNPATGSFCKFEDNIAGVRAATINMRSILTAPTARVMTETGTVSIGRTLRRLIYTWAPLVDTSASANYQNHTAAYLAGVAKKANVSPDFDMTFLTGGATEADRKALIAIIGAMNGIESGEGMTASWAEISAGVTAALGPPPGYVVQPNTPNVIRRDVNASEIIQSADKGALGQQATVIAQVAVPVIAATAGLDWRVAAIMAGVAVIGGTAAFFAFRSIRQDRLRMHREGVA